MTTSLIENNVKKLLREIPEEVRLEAACKTRNATEVQEVVSSGITILGENYVQEAEEIQPKIIKENVRWHLIGHLQRNSAYRAVKLFDMIESLDSIRLAKEINNQCKKINKVIIHIYVT